MIELKGQQATDYLARVRSTIHPKDQFDKLPILASMLDIERAYLQRFIDQGAVDLATLTIDSTGFPELPAWKADLRRAQAELKKIKAERAKNLLPVFKQISNASPAGVIEQGHFFAKNLTEGNNFLIHLAGVDGVLNSWVTGSEPTAFDTEKEEQKKPENRTTSRPLFHTVPSFPGVLFTQSNRNDDTYNFEDKQILVERYGVVAFKYIGPFLEEINDGRSTQLPITLLFIANYNYGYEPSIYAVRVLEPRYSLIDRSFVKSDMNMNKYKYTLDAPKHTKKPKAPPYKALEFYRDNPPHGRLLQLYLSLDATVLSDLEFNNFVASLPALDELIKEIKNFM